jgi:hypothetical protein
MQSTTSLASSSWEAFRLTSKSSTELLAVLGPQGVDDLVHKMLAACWRDIPGESRTLAAVIKAATDVVARNMKVWAAIKKPSPAAFFQDLFPSDADGYLRQAMVLCWMMLPRSGRKLPHVGTIVTDMVQRNLAAWIADNKTFTHGLKPQKKIKKKPNAPKKRR